MGIQPIDLQTLYTQLDKVGKLQGDARQTFAAEFENSQQAKTVQTVLQEGHLTILLNSKKMKRLLQTKNHIIFKIPCLEKKSIFQDNSYAYCFPHTALY